MKPERLILDNRALKERLFSEFIEKISAMEPILADTLRKRLFALTSKKGLISYDKDAERFLIQLGEIIDTAVKKSPLPGALRGLFRDFNEIAKNIERLQKNVNGIRVNMDRLSMVQRAQILKVQQTMAAGGYNEALYGPLKQALFNHVVAGGGIREAEKIILKNLVSTPDADSSLMRYYKTAARDGILQYEGAIQSKIAQAYKMSDYAYIGSIALNSRAQCIKWATAGIITGDKLLEEITWAINKGEFAGKTCSGMYPETTPETFPIHRGGYNCRHTAMPVFSSKSLDEDIRAINEAHFGEENEFLK